MLIAQITDVHLGFDPDNPGELNRQRLDQVLNVLCQGPNRPDLLLATGDLADKGDPESYRQLKEALGICPFPVWPCLGNHDDRTNFLQQFPEIPTADGFAQYEVDLGPLRLIVLDTLEEGRHGGAFCDTRVRWLTERLDEQVEKPVIVVMHHPPFEAGIQWMDIHPEEPWVRRVASALAGRGQVRAVLCGHLHRPMVTQWSGTTLAVCPSTAPQLALDLRPIDPDAPDGRAMIVADPPGFAFHWWNGRDLVTHFETADDHVALAKFDARMQPLVRGLFSERR